MMAMMATELTAAELPVPADFDARMIACLQLRTAMIGSAMVARRNGSGSLQPVGGLLRTRRAARGRR